MSIVGDNYLTRKIGNIQLNKDIKIGSKEQPVTIMVGDIFINGMQDGAINLKDILQIANSFNSSVGNARYREVLDLNKDGTINMLDIMLVAANFNITSRSYESLTF